MSPRIKPRNQSRMLPTWLLAGLVLAGGAAAQPIPRMPVTDVRPVLLSALQAPEGSAHAVLSGPVAEAITRQFQATSPIFIDVATERRYKQPGCSRLQLVLWQDGVQLPPAEAPRRQTIAFGLDYCLDGRPPQSLQ